MKKINWMQAIMLILVIVLSVALIVISNRLEWCNTNSCYTADATDNDLCHRLLAQEPTSTCQYYLDQCNARVDRYGEMLDECYEIAEYAQDHWQYWMDDAAACYGIK